MIDKSTLQGILERMPGVDREAEARARRTREITLTDAVRQPGAATGRAAAQQIGAAVTGQEAQTRAADTQQRRQTLGQLGGLELGRQQQEAQGQVFASQQKSAELQREARNVLHSASEDAARELFDSQMAFQRDEMGRIFLNERQLMDFALQQGIDAEQFRDYEQEVQQATQRSLQILEAEENAIRQALEQEVKKAEQHRDQELIRELRTLEKQTNDRIERQQRMARNITMIVGGAAVVAGTLMTGPFAPLIAGAGTGMLTNSMQGRT